MNQNIWGSHLWFSLHTITFNYPLNPSKDDIENYKNFFTSLKNVIPCSVCKKNYLRHLDELPIDNALTNRKNLVYWLIDMHNTVNGETGKKIWSYDEVLKKYEAVYNKKIILEGDENTIENFIHSKEHFKNKNRNKDVINYLFIIIFILLAINLYYAINKHR